MLGAVDLPLPGGMDMAARTTDEDTKLSIRFLRGFDITENVFISRLDMLYVAACPRPEFAVRVVFFIATWRMVMDETRKRR